MRRSAILALALLLVLSGCNGPAGPSTGTVDDTAGTPSATATPTDTATRTPTTTPTATPTATPIPGPEINVVEGELPDGVDPVTTLHRVEALTGRNVTGLKVFVRERQPRTARPKGFYGALGFSPTKGVGRAATGRYFDRVVQLSIAANASNARVEAALAHQLAHATQDSRPSYRNWQPQRDGTTLDEVFTFRLVSEGAAVYYTDRYVDEHLPGVQNETTYLRELADGSSATARLRLGVFYVGSRYVRGRLGPDGNTSSIYLNPPTTSEQVIHGDAPGEEPPTPLALEVQASGSWSLVSDPVFQGPRDTAGEFLLRTALQTELDRSTALAAAAGWGNDTVVGLSDGNASGYAWALRWDTAGDADEFADAFRTYRERGGGNVSSMRLVRTDEKTTVVLMGDEALVDGATVEGSGADVTVTVGGSGSLRSQSSTGDSRSLRSPTSPGPSRPAP